MNKIRKTFFFKHHTEDEPGRNVPDHFLFIKKGLYEVKASDLQFNFNIFWQRSTWNTIETNYKSLDYFRLLIQRYAQFWFFGKWSGTSFFNTFFVLKKMFARYIVLIGQISLSDCLSFLRCWAICVLQLFANQVVTFKFWK